MLSPHRDCSRQVRCGPNYPKYGKKAPSSAALGTVETMTQTINDGSYC